MENMDKKTKKKWWIVPLLFILWCLVYTALTYYKHGDSVVKVSANQHQMQVFTKASGNR
ncbi:hypothetical protein PP175_07810 [Aneurinibacillus sp. Ricciae_BoGa-3]|uniref:hypothetical protein n=1 Tax=Aneurinibacillus sp. Ricciae_BoGa-3 TaxID=3022697 RepID=UPI00233FDEA2|nr:hypothetical protein [Aneurinibacillus sp. Ricciae_BoGa-3]WCK55830.1 hypothetical protein PP175_07810 [Aneurinibacillus sp. Ricciae_BoGa-3]